MSGDLIFADRKYRKMGGVWMMQPNTLMRGFIAVAEESTIAMLDEIERLRAEVERLTDELQQVANEIALAESQEARRER